MCHLSGLQQLTEANRLTSDLLQAGCICNEVGGALSVGAERRHPGSETPPTLSISLYLSIYLSIYKSTYLPYLSPTLRLKLICCVEKTWFYYLFTFKKTLILPLLLFCWTACIFFSWNIPKINFS